MDKLLRYGAQALFFALLMVFVGWFASRPVYTQFPPDQAQIKLSFAHGAKRVEACRRLTPEEIAKLPARERRPNDCGRERRPIQVELVLDGVQVWHDELQPTGLSGDGPARAYQKFRVQPGSHEIVARLNDSGRADGYDYESRAVVELAPLQSLAIDFKADAGGFVFR